MNHRHSRTPRRFVPAGRIAAVAAPSFNADDLLTASEPLERRGYSVAVVSNKVAMLTAKTTRGEDVHFVPASTVGDMDFDRYCGLILPGGASEIGDSARAAVDRFLKAGKPVIALSDGVALLAEAANAPDAAGAEAAISVRG